MIWLPVLCTDDRLRGLYQRHYSSEKATRRRGHPVAPNQLRVAGPGEVKAYLTVDGRAGWIWRFAKFRKDGQQGVECVLFRNEASVGCHNSSHEHCSSKMVAEADELAWVKWPGQRLFTFVDPGKILSSNPGYCFKRAGWRFCGVSKSGLHILEVSP